jgi:protein SCO1/2
VLRLNHLRASLEEIPFMRVRAPYLLLLLGMTASALTATGCRGTANSPATQSASQAYPIRGTVVSTDPASVEDPSALSELHPGDLITATLLADRDAAGPKNLRLKEIVVIAQARPDYKPKVQYHVPATGDVVPNFTLLNQSDRTISLKQFRGKVVVMTFIYTRCPLSDFCPRMSRNFAEIDKALAADPALYGKTHLLSVSFDPTYDTPKVLRSYGSAYTGQYVKETFQHWDFAAPSVAELPKMEQYFDVGVTPGESGTLQHSLSTIVIGKEGKVIAFYPTNDWTPAQILAQIHTAAA